ncbi:MAG: AraC family transcriptional regulator [Polyangiaceae bacterium]|nr:AraC family transcriptional regulator [Polyangiaceae bacterium]
MALVEALGRFGVDVARLDIGPLDDDAALALMWKRAIARTGRRTLPLEVGLALPLGAMGAIDYLAASSATLGAALTVTQHVFPLVAPGVQLLFEAQPRGARRVSLVNHPPYPLVNHPPYPGQLESDLLVTGILFNRLRQLATRTPDFAALELTAPEPPSGRARWLELLGVRRVRFGARRTAFTLTSADWAIALRSADARLLRTLKAMVGLDHRSSDALLVAVRTLALQRLPAQISLEEAGPALGLSTRTLQRKLSASGTSLSALADELRRDRAEQLVAEGLFTLGEVAARVFAEQASFTRAWRRWFGRPPSQRPRRAEAGRRSTG